MRLHSGRHCSTRFNLAVYSIGGKAFLLPAFSKPRQALRSSGEAFSLETNHERHAS